MRIGEGGGVSAASVVVTSYNYGRYLAAAIESALDQTCPAEVIVVDDGSSDDSGQVIARYGRYLTPLLKEHGGQASAMNAGFRLSKGRVIVFLDSDDVLSPTAVERAVGVFHDPQVVKVHWPLWVIDEGGCRTGRVLRPVLSEGDCRDAVRREGPYGYTWPPTSGNAWARTFLERVLPIPEAVYPANPDLYLCALAPLFGRIGTVQEAQAYWRDHGANASLREPFAFRLAAAVKREVHCLGVLRDRCRELGLDVDHAAWVDHAFWHRVHRAVRDIDPVIPPWEAFILVDADEWATDEVVTGRRRVPFPERHGRYAGPPADDVTAVRELERLGDAGTRFAVFGWPAFWWLKHYTGLSDHLATHARCLLMNDGLVVYDLKPEGRARRER